MVPHARLKRGRRLLIDISYEAIWKVLGTVLVLWLILHLRTTLTLVLLSLILVATLYPLMKRLQQRFSRRVALVTITTGYLLVSAVIGFVLLPMFTSQTLALVESAPDYAQKIQTTLLEHHIHWNVMLQVQATSDRLRSVSNVMSFAEDFLGGLYGVIMVGVLSLYMLIESNQLTTSFLRLIPRNKRLGVRRLAKQMARRMGGYVGGQVLLSTMAGTAMTSILLLLQVPDAVTLGVWAGLADAVPVLGVWLAIIPAGLLALAQYPLAGIAVAVGYLSYHMLELNVLLPRVYRGTMGLSLSMVIISFAAGIELMGITGAVLALPVAAVVPTLVTFIHEWNDAPDTPTGPLPGGPMPSPDEPPPASTD